MSLESRLVAAFESVGVDVKALQAALNAKLDANDPSVTNAREWSASVVSQAEAEAGTATTARKWTAQRVRQAVDASAGSAPNELPSNQHLGAVAFLDSVGATQVTRHTRDSKPGDVWHEWVSNTQLQKKFHGLDGVIRTITETYA